MPIELLVGGSEVDQDRERASEINLERDEARGTQCEKRRSIAAKEVHKAVDCMMSNTSPEEKEYIFDALATLFLPRIHEMGKEEITKAIYEELLLSVMLKKKV